MNQRRADRALADYLDRLLQPEPERSPLPHAEPEALELAPVLLPATRNRLQSLLDHVGELAAVPVVETTTAPVSAIATETMPQVEVQEPEVIPYPVSEVAVAVAQADAIRYSNSRYRSELPQQFPTLVFRIDELKLALPLHLLGGIQRRDKPLTPLVGRPNWFLGLMVHDPININVVDTGRYILGDKYRPELVDGYRYVIRIGDTAWGLACTDLCATRGLSLDEVSWYDSNPRRPWLAGIIKEDRCALLNAQALVDSLEQFNQHAA